MISTGRIALRIRRRVHAALVSDGPAVGRVSEGDVGRAPAEVAGAAHARRGRAPGRLLLLLSPARGSHGASRGLGWLEDEGEVVGVEGGLAAGHLEKTKGRRQVLKTR